MSIKKIVGLVLVVAGVIVLVSRGFDYTQKHKGSVGPFDFSVNEKKHVAVPTWAGVLAVAIGVGLLVLPSKRDR
jgi:drug/metabolite transporter (DMT)-like permease